MEQLVALAEFKKKRQSKIVGANSESSTVQDHRGRRIGGGIATDDVISM